MKKHYRKVPMDAVCVEKSGQTIRITTSGHTICMGAYDGNKQLEFHQFTFDQLFSLITKLRHGIQNDL